MKTKTILAAAAATMLTASGAFAETTVTISDVTVRQRYPWNGLVDISCTVSGIDGETDGLDFAVAAVMPDTSSTRSVKHFQVERDGKLSEDREVRTNGTYRLLWDAVADLGPVRFTNMVVRVTIDRQKVQLWQGGPYWATTNIGAEKPGEYGLYFWWGDTVGYRRKGNAWRASDGSSQSFSFEGDNTPTDYKGLGDLLGDGWVVLMDGTYVLAPAYDAAQAHWGGTWRMPTKSDIDALNSNCDWAWTTQDGVNGYVVRGRGTYASASIFLPAAGSGSGTSLLYSGSDGDYWSSFPEPDWDDSWGLYFTSDFHVGCYNDRSRDQGRPVRPVQGISGMVTLDPKGGTGGTASVTATYGSAMPAITVPTRADYTFAGYWTEANGGGMRYYDASGASTRLWDKTAATTLYAKWMANGEDRARVQLWEGGPYWATTNIGAEEPEEYGLYFWWGDTVGYRRESDAWVASDGSSQNFLFDPENAPTEYKYLDDLLDWVVVRNSISVLAPKHDAAHVHWGGKWRMPTEAELDALNRNCSWTWTTRNGVNGYVVRGNGTYASASIFLPAAGYGYEESLDDAVSYGYYWSSVPYEGNVWSMHLVFHSDRHDVSYYNSRFCGLPVRPVQGFAE